MKMKIKVEKTRRRGLGERIDGVVEERKEGEEEEEEEEKEEEEDKCG